MTGEQDESEDAIAEEVVPLPVNLAIPEPLTALLPWHRARKQAVREWQWVRLATWLVERLKEEDSLSEHASDAEVRLLTLPGRDYLDVRVLGEAVKQQGCTLTVAGFLNDAETSPQSARARFRETQLVQAGVISDRSVTWRMPIEQICRVNSPAHQNLRRFASFHVVNFDACGSLAAPNAEHSNRLIDALFRIVEVQLSKANHRWLLYVTTNARLQDLNTETLQGLNGAVWQNAQQSGTFRSHAESLFGALQEQAVPQGAASDGTTFLKYFSVGLGKWLLHLAAEKLWSVRMHSAFCYGDASTSYPTMPCLAFEFVPPAPGLKDPFQVTRQSPAPGGTTEDLSIRVLDKSAGVLDLDAKLAADGDLRAKLKDATRKLLREVGYQDAVLEDIQ